MEMLFRLPLKPPPGPSSLRNMGVSSSREARFVLAVGLLLSLNSGYINGLCLGGLLAAGGSDQQGVSAFTGTYTKSGLALANGEVERFTLEFTLIISFVGGALVAGLLNPKAVPYRLVPSYGPTFLLGSACMIAASTAAELRPDGPALYHFAAMANGVQNGMTSTYSANLIRTTHLTGTSTDIGLIMGQMLRGNWKNYWKFKVLVGLASSFWFGGFLSYYSASAFLSKSLWFSAGLFLTIGLTHIAFVVLTEHVSFFQACVGAWEWDKALHRIASSVSIGNGSAAIVNLTREQVDGIFDQIDSEGSGVIGADVLRETLENVGMKTTKKSILAMIRVAADDDENVVDRDEFHAVVTMAASRAKRKREKYVAPKPVDCTDEMASSSTFPGHNLA